MRIYTLALFVDIALLTAFGLGAVVAAQLYVTQPGQSKSTHRILYSRDALLPEATTNRESLPAKDFPEGNWGNPVEGLQLSLRFAQETYTNGAAITAIVLARNTTNAQVCFPHSNLAGSGPVGLVATQADGRRLSTIQANSVRPGHVTGTGGWGSVTIIAPKTQYKFLERLDEMYDLTNGEYSVHAVVEMREVAIVDGKPSKAHWVEVQSADVPIKIESAPPSSK